MGLKLYGTHNSVPFRAVLMCAKVLELDLEIVEVNLLKEEHLNADFLKKNPQHTVPLLEDDGFYLVDSHAINAYLVSKYGQNQDSLYPSNDLQRRATIDSRLHFDSSVIAAAGIGITKPLILEDTKPDQKAIDRLQSAFKILEKILEKSTYVVGDELSIADFSFVSTVSSWSYFLDNWKNEFPRISSYLSKLSKQDFYLVNIKGLQDFRMVVDLKLKQV